MTGFESLVLGIVVRITQPGLRFHLSRIKRGHDVRTSARKVVAYALANRFAERHATKVISSHLNGPHSGALRGALLSIAQGYYPKPSRAQDGLVSRFGSLDNVVVLNALYQQLDDAVLQYDAGAQPATLIQEANTILTSDAARQFVVRGSVHEELLQDVVWAMMEAVFGLKRPNEELIELLVKHADVFAPLQASSRHLTSLFYDVLRLRRAGVSTRHSYNVELFGWLQRTSGIMGTPILERYKWLAFPMLPSDDVTKRRLGRVLEKRDPELGYFYLEIFWGCHWATAADKALAKYFEGVLSSKFKDESERRLQKTLASYPRQSHSDNR